MNILYMLLLSSILCEFLYSFNKASFNFFSVDSTCRWKYIKMVHVATTKTAKIHLDNYTRPTNTDLFLACGTPHVACAVKSFEVFEMDKN